MPIQWCQVSIPKRGHTADEYEDAAAANLKLGRLAVADGASESSFASLWARLLVDGFVQQVHRTTLSDNWFQPCQERWAKEVDGKSLPWYAEEKRTLGAFAAYCGLVLRKDLRWRAEAIGDSCLFQVRAGQLLQPFPLTRANDFGNQPKLLGARARPNQDKLRTRLRGSWQAGDRIFLMTDAIAQWCLRRCEEKNPPWQAIAQVLEAKNREAAFADWIEELRARGGLHNDDVTVLSVSL